MKILIADKFEKAGIEGLKGLGAEVVSLPEVGEAGLPGALAEHNPDVLVVRSTKVKGPAFDAAKRLSLVIRAGAGFDNIDLPTASGRGISVATCPGKNSIAVAELAWGLILSADRRIHEQAALLRAGQWNKKEYAKARGLYGKTLGVIGLGQIGAEVASRGIAFGMKVLAHSPSLTDAKALEHGVERVADMLDLARQSDVVSVNVVANDKTKHLCNAAFFEALRPGAIFINTTRGSVVDEAALLRAIETKNVRAGLDVFENEPAGGTAEFKSAISQHASVVGTHHVGASTDQAQQAIADEVVRIVRVYRDTGKAPNVINLAETTAATRLLVVRHLNKPGVLAHVVGEIGRAGINIETMENVIYAGAQAACARITLASEPGAAVMGAIASGSPHILSVDLTAI